MYNPFSLDNKTILVTGASGDIGGATAIECSKMGAKVVLTGRNKERLENVMSALAGEGHAMVCADLTDEERLESVIKELPELDGIVFCAGISGFRPVQSLRLSDVQKMFDVNAFAPMNVLHYILKKRILKKNSSVVFISSISGHSNVSVGLSAYGATKASLTAFARYAALELSPRGIRVNSVLPGRIQTQLIQNDLLDEQAVENDKKKYPLQRYGLPVEVARSVVFLLSEASDWITGTQLVVDGGRSLI